MTEELLERERDRLVVDPSDGGRMVSLRVADHELLTLAGIQGEGRLILKFIPPELELRLIALERERAGDDADRIRATIFQIRAEGGGYAFHVVDQTYRWTGS